VNVGDGNPRFPEASTALTFIDTGVVALGKRISVFAGVVVFILNTPST
jgi:hypothetical protein